MINLDNVKSLNTKNLYSFYIDDFLDINLYEELEKNFPDFYSLDKKKLQDLGHGKYSLKNNSQYYDELINSSEAFDRFFNEILTEEFFKKIFKKFMFQILLSRKINIFDLFKLFKISKFTSNDLGFMEKIFFKKVSVNYELSYMTNGAYIEPHTDSRSKLCSLLLYFPDQKLDKDQKLLEQNIGTQFWISPIENYNNNSFEKFRNNFLKRSTRDKKTLFKKNCLYGFIKNNKSWHSVEKVDVFDKYVRRSININLNFS